MSRKFVVVVLDSFGVGTMDDTAATRPCDIGANTAKHLMEYKPDNYFPVLEKLGLMNVIGEEIGKMHFNPNALVSRANLKHWGADTFFGHQEIMGTNPPMPEMMEFARHIDETKKDLEENGYQVRYYEMNGNHALVVNEGMFVGDNMETDLGQAINVSGTFSVVTFEDVKKVGHIVRKHYPVPRIIAFGGEDVSLTQILASCFTKGEFIGLDTPKAGVYDKGYLVTHIGYGIDSSTQLPIVLHRKGIKTNLYGKVADIVVNDYGKSFYGVDTEFLFNELIKDLKEDKEGFYCLNVQETDLAGHQQDADRYLDRLKVSDKCLDEVIKNINHDDILIVMADHGNDPFIGHSKHTRERVPLLIYKQNLVKGRISDRDTMADVGQTVADYYGTKLNYGTSFLSEIK